MWARILCLLAKEWAQLRRDPRLMGLLLVAPMIQILVLGFAADTDVRDIAVGVRDNDRTWHSREFVRALGASGYLRAELLSGPAEADAERLVAGEAGLILEIPAGFGRALLRREPVAVQVLVDGADSNFAVQGVAYIRRAARQFSEGLVRAAVAPGGGRPGPAVIAESRVWYNPELRSRFYMVPAIMALLLLVVTMLVTSMALVKEREDGTMEQLIVTPLRPAEIMIGKLLPFGVAGVIEISLALPLMLGIFGVPFRGSLLFLYAMSGLFLMTTLGLGLFISTVVRTQQQAMMVAAFFVMMPFVLLSGFAFSVENMPPVIRAVAECIPLRHYLVILRGVFLKGAGWTELWPHAMILFVWGAGILALAVSKFRKRLD